MPWDGQNQCGNHGIVQRYSDAMPQLIHWQQWDAKGEFLDQVAR